MDRKEILIIILVLLLAGTIGYLIYAKNSNLLDSPAPSSPPPPAARIEPDKPTTTTPAQSATIQTTPPVVTEEKLNELDSQIKELESEDPNDQDLLVE
jgi:hypothetical protein